jgi:CO/xanthine dehydrogenase Mo-binding subunit
LRATAAPPRLWRQARGLSLCCAVGDRLSQSRTGQSKWVEERNEHLVAATSATNRVTTLSAAVDDDGIVTALDWDQLEDCGAYLRALEPETLYRMHGNMSGAYRGA